jgi:hypothetical protein
LFATTELIAAAAVAPSYLIPFEPARGWWVDGHADIAGRRLAGKFIHALASPADDDTGKCGPREKFRKLVFKISKKLGVGVTCPQTHYG